MDPKQAERKRKTDKVLAFIQTQLDQGKNPKDIYNYLVQKGIPDKNAREFVQQVLDQQKQAAAPPVEPALDLQAGKNQKQVLFNYIDQQLAQGISQQDIVDTLESKGIARDVAIDMVLNITEHQLEEMMIESGVAPVEKSGSGQNKIFIGILLLVGGGIITFASYNAAAPGGTYYLFYGPMIYGAISIISGLIDWFR